MYVSQHVCLKINSTSNLNTYNYWSTTAILLCIWVLFFVRGKNARSNCRSSFITTFHFNAQYYLF